MGFNILVEHVMATRFRRAVLQSLASILALAALTAVCDGLHLNLATASLLYVIVVVLLARVGSLLTSIMAAVIAAVLLAYLAPPSYSFRVNDPLDVVAVAAFLITSLTIAGLVLRVRRMAEEAASSVSRKLIDAEERERSRIGRELDADICQRIALLAIKFDRVRADFPDLSAEMILTTIDELRQEMGELSSSTQALAHTLHSQKLEYLGLVASVRGFCREFGHEHKVEIGFRGQDLQRAFAPDVSLALYRVVQEALHNSAKHSGARQFEVDLFEESDAIHLLVRDWGQGFDPETALNNGGLGLASMRERLKLVKGELSIESQRNGGTTIHARVPVVSGRDSNHSPA